MTIEDKAKEFKDLMNQKLKSICQLMDAANAAGFKINFNVGEDPTGKNIITKLDLLRKM